ncbi:helix-turn-helix domain-containing protein [Amycolatopsis japonica]
MRGAGDQLSIGERIAFYRRRRGLSQAVLADLVGRTEDWLSKIEHGEREIRRMDGAGRRGAGSAGDAGRSPR